MVEGPENNANSHNLAVELLLKGSKGASKMASEALLDQRERAAKLLQSRPAAGADGVEAIFRYLWHSDLRDSATLPGFHIPHTISIKLHEFDSWIFSGFHGEIQRKRRDDVTISAIEEHFSQAVGASGVAAILIDPLHLNGKQHIFEAPLEVQHFSCRFGLPTS